MLNVRQQFVSLLLEEARRHFSLSQNFLIILTHSCQKFAENLNNNSASSIVIIAEIIEAVQAFPSGPKSVQLPNKNKIEARYSPFSFFQLKNIFIFGF